VAILCETDQRWARLLQQQLHPGEVLDGVFAVGQDRTAAVTSERFMIAGPTDPDGWALKSIPWRLINWTVVDLVAEGAEPAQAVRLTYALPARPAPRMVAPTEQALAAGDLPEALSATEPPGELLLLLAGKEETLTALLSARTAGAVAS
jgi:hypothetical protein